MQFYTYAHYKPNGEIFYIGKGQGMRYKFISSGRSKHWHEAAKDGFDPIILARWPSEDEALEHEAFLISCFDGKLVNRTTGGQRGRHAPITEETRQRMIAGQRKLNERRLSDPEWNKRIGEARSKATQSRAEGYQSIAGMVFKEKILSDPEFSKRISENRKKAKIASMKALHLKMGEKVKQVRRMRLEGAAYKKISECTEFSISMISNILLGKAYVGVGEI
jgi:hypothetical protein